MKNIRLLIGIALLSLTSSASASKLVSASIVDKDGSDVMGRERLYL